MLVLPVCGTLRGAGDEKVGRCFEGVLVEAVGVAMVAGGSERSIARYLDWESFRDSIAGYFTATWCASDVVKEECKGGMLKLTRVRSWRLTIWGSKVEQHLQQRRPSW
jgi:hypothetical protein